ncbi:MAG: hypothetical protein QXJ45_08185 [Thermoproteota archaeon]
MSEILPKEVYDEILPIRELIEANRLKEAEKAIVDKMQRVRGELRKMHRRRTEYLFYWKKLSREPFVTGVDVVRGIFKIVFRPRPMFPLGLEYDEIMHRIRIEELKLEELKKLHATIAKENKFVFTKI